MSDSDDNTLVAAVVLRGDPDAFSILYARHARRLYGLALRLTGGSHADAEDVVHDAWVRAIERMPQFEGRAAFSTWLCGFVVRRSLELGRQRGRQLPAEDHVHAGDDRQLTDTFDRIVLERAIAELAEGYRTVLVLHDIHGHTHQEIGTMLGVEPGTSKSQLARARRALRIALGVSERT